MKSEIHSLFRDTVAYLLHLYCRFRSSELHMMLLWAVLTGFVGALATIVFRDGIKDRQWLLVGRSGSLVEMAKVLPWYLRVALPSLGGLVTGCFMVLAKRFAADIASDYMEAVDFGNGRIPARHTLPLYVLSSSLSFIIVTYKPGWVCMTNTADSL